MTPAVAGDQVCARMRRIRSRMHAQADVLRVDAQKLLDWRYYVTTFPWTSLGLALIELSGVTCAVVDANVFLPALSRIVEENPQRQDDESFFATRWLHGSLALLTPPGAREAGMGLPELGRLIKHGRELFAFMICDLTGFDGLGEHLGAMDLMEGVILVAPAGKINEGQLLRFVRDVPPKRRLGVLLQGPKKKDL